MADSSVIDPELIIAHKFPEITYTYTERDVALYALGIGACGRDAVDGNELKYVYHQDDQQFIQVLPTFSVLCTYDTFSRIPAIPGLQYDPRLLLHGQQYMEIYKPFPSSGCIINKSSISGLHDKGKATVVELEIRSYEKESGELLSVNWMSLFLRGTGGFSKSSHPYSYSKNPNSQNIAVKIPTSQPFVVHEECTQQSQKIMFLSCPHCVGLTIQRSPCQQALLYRLSGDYNPLHSDPVVAEIAGFSRPILHGLCTLGFAVRAIIRCICRGDPSVIKNVAGRFLLHVYPGETLITEMWLDGLRVVFQVKVKERNRTALSGFVGLGHLRSSV